MVGLPLPRVPLLTNVCALADGVMNSAAPTNRLTATATAVRSGLCDWEGVPTGGISTLLSLDDRNPPRAP
jgi:hypothetical protein